MARGDRCVHGESRGHTPHESPGAAVEADALHLAVPRVSHDSLAQQVHAPLLIHLCPRQVGGESPGAPTSQVDEALELLMAQDAIRIVDALRIPTDWQMGTTGILSVVQDGDPGTTTLPGEGTARIIILGFPFTIEMEACC